jgi:deoxyribonuclease V
LGQPEAGPFPAGSRSATDVLFVAVDVHYLPHADARAAMVAARDRRFCCVARTGTALVSAVAPYRPGEFYRRELPPLRAVIPASAELALIVVDGYVDLDPDGRRGLGAHVHEEFGVPVVGVAKTAFAAATHAARVYRGRSARPLYVTAAGMTIADAAGLVAAMAGQFRMPDALKRVDRLARGLEAPRAVEPGRLWERGCLRAGRGRLVPEREPRPDREHHPRDQAAHRAQRMVAGRRKLLVAHPDRLVAEPAGQGSRRFQAVDDAHDE